MKYQDSADEPNQKKSSIRSLLYFLPSYSFSQCLVGPSKCRERIIKQVATQESHLAGGLSWCHVLSSAKNYQEHEYISGRKALYHILKKHHSYSESCKVLTCKMSAHWLVRSRFHIKQLRNKNTPHKVKVGLVSSSAKWKKRDAVWRCPQQTHPDILTTAGGAMYSSSPWTSRASNELWQLPGTLPPCARRTLLSSPGPFAFV